MTNAQEKRVKLIAEHKGFRLDKAGHGKGHGRFYIMNLAESLPDSSLTNPPAASAAMRSGEGAKFQRAL